ncbi:Chromodomain-helicase DNA-binding protein [Scheffersomyces xylosifermentans]|uniref:Chromodomain-helicase DNA-binding protein n=1 Tax=Scheffersomyces xylosifermentans TaxID=1304137 RepID=UPI00315D9394
MGTCIATVKFVGLASLGLLSGSLTYQSIESIPLLINDLSRHWSTSASGSTSATIREYVAKVKTLISTSRISNVVFGSLASVLFTLAFTSAPPSGKHPYLIYAALGGPLTIAGLYYKAYAHEQKLLNIDNDHPPKTKEQVKAKKEVKKVPVVPAEAAEQEEDDSLGKSYIHISDESTTSSTSSTPNASVPGSPQIESIESIQPEEDREHELTVADEVESALTKKEFLSQLEGVKSSYAFGSAISGVSFFIAVVGLIGDYYLL